MNDYLPSYRIPWIGVRNVTSLPICIFQVGIKTVSAEGKSAKEFELILKKNNAYNTEGKYLRLYSSTDLNVNVIYILRLLSE